MSEPSREDHKRGAIRVWCAYAHQDEIWCSKLARHLSPLVHEGLIELWDDHLIPPGANREHAIKVQVERAGLILLLVSSDFLAWYPSAVEVQRALERQAAGQVKVVPILLRPCDWQMTPFGGLQALPANDRFLSQWSEREEDEAWVMIAKGIRQAVVGRAPGGKASEVQNTPVKESVGMSHINVLFLAANPLSTDRLAIDEEMRAIEQRVRASAYRDALTVQSSWAVRPSDLLQLLDQHRPQVVHFSGHGSGTGLYLAGNDGQARLVTTRALESLFTTLKDNIRLVFLNACYSREQAQALVKTIDCVVGMKESIHDDAAAVFASSFYGALGFGRSIKEAFDQGRTALLLEGIPDEDIPELLVRDGVDPNMVVLIGHETNPR